MFLYVTCVIHFIVENALFATVLLIILIDVILHATVYRGVRSQLLNKYPKLEAFISLEDKVRRSERAAAEAEASFRAPGSYVLSVVVPETGLRLYVAVPKFSSYVDIFSGKDQAFNKPVGLPQPIDFLSYLRGFTLSMWDSLISFRLLCHFVDNIVNSTGSPWYIPGRELPISLEASPTKDGYSSRQVAKTSKNFEKVLFSYLSGKIKTSVVKPNSPHPHLVAAQSRNAVQSYVNTAVSAAGFRRVEFNPRPSSQDFEGHSHHIYSQRDLSQPVSTPLLCEGDCLIFHDSIYYFSEEVLAFYISLGFPMVFTQEFSPVPFLKPNGEGSSEMFMKDGETWTTSSNYGNAATYTHRLQLPVNQDIAVDGTVATGLSRFNGEGCVTSGTVFASMSTVEVNPVTRTYLTLIYPTGRSVGSPKFPRSSLFVTPSVTPLGWTVYALPIQGVPHSFVSKGKIWFCLKTADLEAILDLLCYHSFSEYAIKHLKETNFDSSSETEKSYRLTHFCDIVKRHLSYGDCDSGKSFDEQDYILVCSWFKADLAFPARDPSNLEVDNDTRFFARAAPVYTNAELKLVTSDKLDVRATILLGSLFRECRPCVPASVKGAVLGHDFEQIHKFRVLDVANPKVFDDSTLSLSQAFSKLACAELKDDGCCLIPTSLEEVLEGYDGNQKSAFMRIASNLAGDFIHNEHSKNDSGFIKNEATTKGLGRIIANLAGVSKIFNAPYCKSLQRACFKLLAYFSPGMNYSQITTFFEELRSNPLTIGLISCDFSAFDGTISGSMQDFALSIFLGCFDTEHHDCIRAHFAREQNTTMHFKGHERDFSYKTGTSRLSGSAATTVSNTLIASLAIFLTYFKFIKSLSNGDESEASMIELSYQYTKFAIAAGDDTVLSIISVEKLTDCESRDLLISCYKQVCADIGLKLKVESSLMGYDGVIGFCGGLYVFGTARCTRIAEPSRALFRYALSSKRVENLLDYCEQLFNCALGCMSDINSPVIGIRGYMGFVSDFLSKFSPIHFETLDRVIQQTLATSGVSYDEILLRGATDNYSKFRNMRYRLTNAMDSDIADRETQDRIWSEHLAPGYNLTSELSIWTHSMSELKRKMRTTDLPASYYVGLIPKLLFDIEPTVKVSTTVYDSCNHEVYSYEPPEPEYSDNCMVIKVIKIAIKYKPQSPLSDISSECDSDTRSVSGSVGALEGN